jgi:hypothetical protein
VAQTKTIEMRPADKLIFKYPMRQIVITARGSTYQYYFDEKGINWIHIGEMYIEKNESI